MYYVHPEKRFVFCTIFECVNYHIIHSYSPKIDMEKSYCYDNPTNATIIPHKTKYKTKKIMLDRDHRRYFIKDWEEQKK